jgi:predicted TPR repeat methyltransferase
VDPDRARDYRGQDAAQYESQAAAVAWHGHEIMFGLMYEFIEPGEALLDIGIGTGLGSLLFHKAGLRVSGFDTSIDMLEVCKSKGFSGEVVQHDLRDVPFPYETGSFHHATSLGVLNFFEDLEPVLGEVARLIRSKGVFGFTVEEKKPGQEAHYVLRVDRGAGAAEAQHEVALYRHSDEQIRGMLEGVGLRVLKEFEFLADRYPEQGIEVYLKAYVARKERT